MFSIFLTFLFSCDKPEELEMPFISDYDGNTYRIATIGPQTWMAENLKVTHYPNGKEIKLVSNDSIWVSLADNDTDKAYSVYNNNANGEKDAYGALYTYSAAKDVCPDGWHLPSDEEWVKLRYYVGNINYYGKEAIALKTKTGWKAKGNGDNEFGFSALPGGNRDLGKIGLYRLEGYYGEWWSATPENSVEAVCYRLVYNHYKFYRDQRHKSGGCSIRCVKDKVYHN
ncbi:MAG: FISUMP domain-containing protein [Salinivirgaceae bacterium]|nr:FISUMP domain-containing protein [Salinivirgaceae bacterium]